MSAFQIIFAVILLAATAGIVWLLEKKSPGWKNYPGFWIPPKIEKFLDAVFPCPLLAAGCVCVACLLELCAFSLTGPSFLLFALKLLPAPCLAFQLAELLLAAKYQPSKEKWFLGISWAKWIFLLLWVLVLFGLLFYRAALL